MKHLLIALIALTITLGVACKKEKIVEPVKKELSVPKMADAPAEGGIGGYPGGANTYPHNTGICYCGQYSVCHPVINGGHKSDCPVLTQGAMQCTCKLD